ncbi:MAG: hypothetical protein MUE46_08400 [Xanthomonadales bacterium]|jgi:hypothetical protein|nr:hypothetical protein [Xanthomonadales bacterium]
MLIRFVEHLRAGGLPIGLQEVLALLGALRADVVAPSIEEFHALARACLVKREGHYDLYDRLYGRYFEGVHAASVEWFKDLPAEWLKALAKREFTDEEKAALEKLGSFEELMQKLRERMAEQHQRHQGGNRYIGTGGTSPFGNSGYHPEGVRIGGQSTHRRATKVWEERNYRDLDGDAELNTRNFKLALRRLRRFAREGATEELALDDTISATAQNAGWLDLKFRAERHNAVKVLLLIDIGGSMDDHIRICEELFAAAKSEFKHLVHYYFHNCVYERVWRENKRRREQALSTHQLLHTYPGDYRLIVLGDASMNPYELLSPGASVEHFNEEAGVVWMRRLLAAYPHAVWLNPAPANSWAYTTSIGIVRELMQERMYPLTLDGLSAAIAALKQPMAAEPAPA